MCKALVQFVVFGLYNSTAGEALQLVLTLIVSSKTTIST